MMDRLKPKKSQKGFGLLLVVVLAVVMLGVGFSGWLVWQKVSTQAKNAPGSTATTQTASRPQSVTLKYSHLRFALNGAWQVDFNDSDINASCGKQDFLSLSKPNSAFVVRISLGECGKGGGDCTAFDGCKAEIKQVKAVQLSATHTAYIVVNRISQDNGKTWDFGLWLTDDRTCPAGNLCLIDVPGFESNPGAMFGSYEGEGGIPGHTQTVDDFIKLPEVQAAIKLFESARYT